MTTAKELMNTDVLCVDPDDAVEEVIVAMLTRSTKRPPSTNWPNGSTHFRCGGFRWSAGSDWWVSSASTTCSVTSCGPGNKFPDILMFHTPSFSRHVPWKLAGCHTTTATLDVRPAVGIVFC